MLVSFWSPPGFNGKVTSTMAIVSSFMSLNYQIKILMTSAKSGNVDLDSLFSYLLEDINTMEDNGGLKSVERLIVSGKLVPQNIVSHSSSIFRDKLDLLSVSGDFHIEEFSKMLSIVLDMSRKVYSLTFVDLGDRDDQLEKSILEKSDLVVVVASQSPKVWDSSMIKLKDSFKGKKVIFVVSDYDRLSVFNISKLVSKVKLDKKDCFVIPRNTAFMDSCYNDNIVDFVLRSVRAKSKFLTFDEESYFNEQVRLLSKRVLSKLELFSLEEEVYDG